MRSTNTFLLIVVCLFQCIVAFSAPRHADSIPPKTVLLPEVMVKRPTTGARISGDTISFDGKKWMDAGVLKLEDLLKKIPGFQVDGNGRILYNGREISRILLDGEDLAGMRYNLLSRNLRAALVDSVQVIGQYQQNRLMKGFVQSGQTALNIRIGEVYNGRISGSAALSRSFSNHGKAELDLSRIHRSNKHLFFVNTNNTGDHGVLDQTMGSGVQSAEETERPFASWPFTQGEDPVFASLPNAYKKMNRDKTGLYLGSFSVGRFSKMRVNAHGLGTDVYRFSSRFTEVDFKDQWPFNVYSQLSLRQHQHGAGMGIQLDMDKQQKRVSSVKLDLVSSTTTTGQIEDRFSLQHSQFRIRDTLKTTLLQVEYRESWLLKKHYLLVLKNKLALDHNMQHLAASGYPAGWLVEALQESVYKQALLHSGVMMFSDLVLMKAIAKWKAQLGWRNQFDRIHSATHDQLLHRRLFRSYAQAFLQYQRNKQWSFELHAAAGSVLGGAHDGPQLVYPVFHLEPAIRWKPRVMTELRISYLVSRKTPDLFAFHSGPVLISDGSLRNGSDQFSLPLHTAVQVELRNTDLYNGFTGFFVARFSAVKNEVAYASTINAVFEKTGFFLRPSSNMVFLSSGAEKFFHALRISYKVNLSFNALQAIQQVNGLNAYNHMTTVLLDHRITTKWKGVFQWECYHLYSGNHLVSSSFGSPASARREQVGLVQQINLSKVFHANLQASVIRVGARENFPMIDATVRSSISRSWKVSLTLSNLANQVRFKAYTAGLLGMGFQELQLYGRRILLGLQWGF